MFILISMKLKILLTVIVLLYAACSKENPAVIDESNGQSVHEKFDLRILGDDPLLDSRRSGNPKIFLENVYQMMASDSGQMILVDKEHSLGPDYRPAELVSLSEYPELITAKNGLMLERRAAEELVELSAAAAADGVTLIISSAYRSYEYQKDLFRRFAERDGEEAASRYSAREGTSQHQLGTTVDFGDITNSFASSDAGIWMENNAGGFGWSLSYPRDMEELTGYKWESWHWRWIGVDAVIMQDRYFDGSQQQLLEYWNENAPVFTEALIH